MRRSNAFNYYEAFAKQAHFFHEMVHNLASAVEKGELGSRSLMTSLHTIENDADAINHSILDHLLSDFVVPMERGSMADLAHSLDDVSDAVEQIAITAYTRKLEYAAGCVPPEVSGMISFLKDGSERLGLAVTLLSSYSKNRLEIKRLCVEAQSCESKADELFIDSVRALYEDEAMRDGLRRSRHDLLESIEDAMDSLENAAEVLESIVAESV